MTNWNQPFEKDGQNIIRNSITTPDGTVLTSRHRHDFVTHVDKKGKVYGVDGGLSYFRRIGDVNKKMETSIISSATFHGIRKHFEWGTYGKNKDQKLFYKKLKDMSDNHIKNILIDFIESPNYYERTSFIKKILDSELEYREEENIEVED